MDIQDWRLPNIKELALIVDYTKTSSPAINTTFSPNKVASIYGSSTTVTGHEDFVWLVNFDDGNIGSSMKSFDNNIRVCVEDNLEHTEGVCFRLK